MDVTGAAVWLGRADGSLTRLDPVTRARQTFDLGVRVKALAAGPEAIWAADYEGAVVLRLDPSTSKVVPIVVGGRPAGVAIAADGSVWVTIQSR